MMTNVEKRNQLFKRWVDTIKELYTDSQHEERYSEIDMNTIKLVSKLIFREEYRKKPVSCIFLDGAHVDEAKMLYKGVNVSVVSNPPVDLDIQYTCVYMDPIQELVLTALGRVLLETYFPSMFDKSRVESFFRHFHTHSNVSELLIIRYERSLTGVAPSSLLGFFEDQLTNVDGINNYMWGLLKSFLLMPYVNCWNSPENRLPPFKENDFSVNGDPLPFGLYLLDSFYPVPYLFQFFLNIFLCKKLKPIMEDLPEEFNYHVDFFYLYTFVVISGPERSSQSGFHERKKGDKVGTKTSIAYFK